MASARTPEQTRQNMLTLLGGAETAAETARAGVVASGVPDVEKGRELASRLATSVESARDAYGKAKHAVEQLPTTEEKPFYDGVTTAMETLGKEYRPESTDPAQLDSAALRDAFTTAEGCQGS
jgi:hypothetical protein